MTPRYPNKDHIKSVFSHLASGDKDAFFANVIPDVDWTVMSQSVLGGTYHSVSEFRSKTFGRLGAIMHPDTPMRIKVHNIIGGGPDDEWAVVELRNEGKMKNGMNYNQTYAWVTKWNTEGKIVQVRAYLDSALVRDVIEANEKE